jgi:hypothetical protein
LIKLNVKKKPRLPSRKKLLRKLLPERQRKKEQLRRPSKKNSERR